MTRPRGELTTYRARGGHATDWGNPTQSLPIEHHCEVELNEFPVKILYITLPLLRGIVPDVMQMN